MSNKSMTCPFPGDLPFPSRDQGNPTQYQHCARDGRERHVVFLLDGGVQRSHVHNFVARRVRDASPDEGDCSNYDQNQASGFHSF